VVIVWVTEDRSSKEGAEYGYGEAFRALRDDRPSTGPLGRSEKAALVSGSSSALLGRRRRVSAGLVVAPRGWTAVPRGGVVASRGWTAVPRGGVVASRGWLLAPGWLVALIGWLALAAARTGCVAPESGFMLWTGCVAA
jgi:hypothetical protein